MDDRYFGLYGKKEASKKQIEKNTKHCIRKTEKKCDDAKEKWLNDKCRNIELYYRSTEKIIYKNTEEISGKKTCSSTGCQVIKR